VTTAESGPRDGKTENTTVSEVEVAAETVPAAPAGEKTTELPAAVGSKPEPVITIEGALLARLVVIGVTTGAATTVATCTAAPLLPPKEMTTAESGPRDGETENTTVSEVAVAAEIEATVPLLRETTLPAGVGSKLKPLMTSEVAVVERLAELVVTMGAGGGVVGEGVGALVGAGVGLPLPPSGAMMSPSCGVCASPVAGSVGSDESGAAATVKLWAERPAAGGGGADSFLLRPAEASPAAGSDAHPTPTEVTR